jgi:hypoxanthine-guanine phosphoribosyltransferase
MIAKINTKSASIQKRIDQIKQEMAIHRAKYMKERGQMESQIDILIEKRKSEETRFILEISDRIDNGESISMIAKKFKVSQSAVDNWKKNLQST